VIAGALVLATGCTISGTADASLLVVNDSDFVIEELYLTDIGSGSWGRNLLAGDVLYPGEELLLAVECGYYDALLVDEDGVDCEIHDIDLCLNDATWVIRNNTCTVFEAGRSRGDVPVPSSPAQPGNSPHRASRRAGSPAVVQLPSATAAP